MESLKDKDVFIVKLPNKLKQYLKDPQTFTLEMEEDGLGRLTQEQKSSEEAHELAANPELFQLGKREAFTAKMSLNIPVKR